MQQQYKPVHGMAGMSEDAMAAGAKDMSQVPVQWGVHEDVFCAVRLPRLDAALSLVFCQHGIDRS